MEILSANKAKTHFGEMLMKVQKEPVQIDKNGKPVAVVISIEDYEATEVVNLEILKQNLKLAQHQIKNGEYVNGNEFFEKLLAGDLDEWES